MPHTLRATCALEDTLIENRNTHTKKTGRKEGRKEGNFFYEHPTLIIHFI